MKSTCHVLVQLLPVDRDAGVQDGVEPVSVGAREIPLHQVFHLGRGVDLVAIKDRLEVVQLVGVGLLRQDRLALVADLVGAVKSYSMAASLQDRAMNTPEEFTVPQAAAYFNVSDETVRRNIRSKRLQALCRGTQWFIPRDVLLVIANSYDPKTGQIRQML